MENIMAGKSWRWQNFNAIIIALAILYFGQALLVPMCYGLLIAIVLYPVCIWLEKHHWPRSFAITASLIVVIILFFSLIALLLLQLNIFSKDLPNLLHKLKPAIIELQQSITSKFGLSADKQHDWWQQIINSVNGNAGDIARNTLTLTTNMIISLFLIPVYAALFLYHRNAFVTFLKKIIAEKYRERLPSLLNDVIHTYFNFIKGMLKVYLIVGILNSVGLMALGIRHAILFGMLTAIMTIIPYVGIIISALLPISVAWITKDSIWYPIGVVAVFAFVQYLEANVIFPRVVASQLKVSTWATLVAIVTGGLLWGVSGMILFIPFLGIFKIILDYIPEWEAINILLKR